jgi:hypothetical protein
MHVPFVLDLRPLLMCEDTSVGKGWQRNGGRWFSVEIQVNRAV